MTFFGEKWKKWEMEFLGYQASFSSFDDLNRLVRVKNINDSSFSLRLFIPSTCGCVFCFRFFFCFFYWQLNPQISFFLSFLFFSFFFFLCVFFVFLSFFACAKLRSFFFLLFKISLFFLGKTQNLPKTKSLASNRI